MLFTNLDLPERGRDVARILADYDPELSLERLPDNHPYLAERPTHIYAVIHRPLGLPEYIVDVFPETMLDERILAQVWEWDMRRYGKKLDKFHALEYARWVREERARADKLAEDRDRMKFKLKQRRWE